MLEQPHAYRNYVAVEDGRVPGLLSLLHAGGTALVNELVVSEKARGREL